MTRTYDGFRILDKNSFIIRPDNLDIVDGEFNELLDFTDPGELLVCLWNVDIKGCVSVEFIGDYHTEYSRFFR